LINPIIEQNLGGFMSKEGVSFYYDRWRGFTCGSSAVYSYSEGGIKEKAKEATLQELFNTNVNDASTNPSMYKQELVARCKQMKLPERIRELIEEKSLRKLRQVSNGWLTLAIFLGIIMEMGLAAGLIKAGIKSGWDFAADTAFWRAFAQLEAFAVSVFAILGLFPVGLMRFLYNTSMHQNGLSLDQLSKTAERDLGKLEEAKEHEAFQMMAEWRQGNVEEAIAFLKQFLGKSEEGELEFAS
jgi:hypothetical protein